MMYDELIRQMKACCKGSPCEEVNCGFNSKSDLDCIEQLLTKAADAIEELLAERDEINADSWKRAYEVEHDEHRWIPVTERLPEVHENVLVIDKAHDIGIGSLEPLWDGTVWVVPFADVDDEFCMITHWMPLPEPPESEKQNG